MFYLLLLCFLLRWQIKIPKLFFHMHFSWTILYTLNIKAFSSNWGPAIRNSYSLHDKIKWTYPDLTILLILGVFGTCILFLILSSVQIEFLMAGLCLRHIKTQIGTNTLKRNEFTWDDFCFVLMYYKPYQISADHLKIWIHKWLILLTSIGNFHLKTPPHSQ